MATQPQSSLSDRPALRVMNGGRKSRKKSFSSTRARLLSTGLALVVLALVFRFLPTGTNNPQANAKQASLQVNPADLQLSSTQMSQAFDRNAFYVDGRVTNEGNTRITGATAEVTFLNLQHQPIASVQLPLAGVPHGGEGSARNEFSSNPIGPNETRFFRIVLETPPADWNHEVPELKLVAAKGN